MAGRLQILGKKSYCPWKKDNLERVQRDEREERLRQERQRQQEAAALLEIRCRGARGGDAEEGHVNLFAKEEWEAAVRTKKNSSVDCEHALTPPMGNGNTKPQVKHKSNNNGDSSSDMQQAKERSAVKEREIKARMDPMRVYHQTHHLQSDNKDTKGSRKRPLETSDGDSDTDDSELHHRRRRRRERKSCRRHHQYNSKKKSSKGTPKPSLEELRRKRVERERTEKERLERVLR